MQVPLLDLRAQYSPLKAEILETVAELCDSQRFILGPKVEAFEQELAAYCQSGGAVGVTSGSDALIIALMVEGIKLSAYAFGSTTCCFLFESVKVPNSLQPHAHFLLCPWNSPGKNTGVGCHFLLQGTFFSSSMLIL